MMMGIVVSRTALGMLSARGIDLFRVDDGYENIDVGVN